MRSSARSPTGPSTTAARSSLAISSGGRAQSSGRASSCTSSSARSAREATCLGKRAALWYLALTEWRAGDWVEADRCATASLELDAQLGPVSVNEAFAPTIVDAHLGRVDRARRTARAAIERSREEGVLVGESGFNWVLGSLELSARRPGDALPHLRRAHELRNATFVLEPGMRLEVGDLVEALVAGERARRGRRALLAVEGRARRARPRVGAGGDRALPRPRPRRARRPRRRVRELRAGARRARPRHGPVPARAHAARARPDAATRQEARRRPDDARRRAHALRGARRAALGRADPRRARAGSAVGHPRGASSPRPSAGSPSSSPRARRNREVAAELFLTEHSVETALSRHLPQARDPLARRARARAVKDLRFPAFARPGPLGATLSDRQADSRRDRVMKLRIGSATRWWPARRALALGATSSSSATGDNAVVHWSEVAEAAISAPAPTPSAPLPSAGEQRGARGDGARRDVRRRRRGRRRAWSRSRPRSRAARGASADAAVGAGGPRRAGRSRARDRRRPCRPPTTRTWPAIPDGAAKDGGKAVGAAAAAGMLACASGDHFDDVVPYVQPTPGPGVFEPIAPA